MPPKVPVRLRREIEAKLLLTDEELMSEGLLPPGQGIVRVPAKRRARETAEFLKTRLRRAICTNPKVITGFEKSKSDTVILVAAVIDAIADKVLGFPPANIAILIYRAGLPAYCGKGWPLPREPKAPQKKGRHRQRRPKKHA